jgi:predicted NBD/HSP70 family sugar kinase
MTFFEEINNDNLTGVALKNITIKKLVISYFAKIGNCTIADLCKELGLSAPKITSILTDLIADGLVNDYGKIESTGGRKSHLYGLSKESAFFIGVDQILENQLFKLRNNQESLDELCNLINEFINGLLTPKDKILGICINLSGRINYSTGYSYSFFHFNEEPLSKVLESALGIKVFLENDSRAMAYGEFYSNNMQDDKNALFLNLDYGLGMGIMINDEIYYGKSGFAGEFGHIPFFKNEIICHCGKKGCLETEASGWALTRMFKEKIREGSSSIIKLDPEEIELHHIIEAAKSDDTLAIELIAKIGENLGRGIAMLINILNPNLIIMGGILTSTGEYLTLPIKSAINKCSLSLVNADTKMKTSKLGEQAGVIGACLLVRNRLFDL